MKKILLTLFCLANFIAFQAQTIITLGSGSSFNGVSESSPINIYYRSHHCQIIYTPAELNTAGWVGASTITKLGFNIFGTTSEALPNFSIKLKNSSSSDLAVYDGNGLYPVLYMPSYQPTAGGFELITLDSPFNWDGTSNLLVDVCFDQVGAWTSTGQVYTYPSTGGNQYSSVRDDNSSQCGIATSAPSNLTKPQLQLEMNPLAACTGSPLPGAAVVTNACTSVSSLTLSLEGVSIASGINYQWQSSSDASTWTNMGTAQTDHHYVVTSLPAITYFRCVSTCTNGGFNGTSSHVLVHPSTSMNCHCKPYWPNYMVDCTQDRFVDFSFGNVINQPTNCDAYGYSDSTGSVNTQINLQQGVGYMLSVNTLVSGSTGDAFTGAWIDFDQNGTFDASEYTPLGSGQSGNYQSSITIPLTAALGSTRMRLAMDAYFASPGTILSPCSNNTGSLGQILDYRVNVTAPPPCSGTPNAGNATASQALACPNVPIDFDLTGNDINTGLEYQWFSSPDNTVWSTLGTTSTTSTLSIASQTATTYYQCVVTCTASALTGTSTPIVVAQNLLVNCHCTPDFINCNTGDIFNQVDFAGITDNPPCSAGDNGYQDRTSIAPTATVMAGQTFTMDLNIGTSGNGGAYVSAWIDENQNGVFEGNEHRVLAINVTTPVTSTISLPFTTLGGVTRMRLKIETSWAGSLNQDPCLTNGTYGQTADYYLGVIPAPGCAGMPNAGDATSNNTAVCANVPYTLDLTNNDQESGLLFQWQSSLNGSTWSNYGPQQSTVPMPTPGQTVTTHYRCLVTCIASAQTATSSPIVISQNALTACYCTPPPINCNNNYITNVTFETINDNPTCATAIGGYNDNTSLVAPAVISASQIYTISIGMNQQFGESFAAVWIDYNQNGVFESYEEFNDLGSITTSGAITGTITVPFTAVGGATRMRVKMENVPFPGFGGFDPCLNDQTEGQTIDYAININPSPACSGPSAPNAGDTDPSSLTICKNDGVNLTLINNDHLSNLSYQWQSSTDNVIWTNLGAPQSMVPYCVTSQTVITHYRCIVTCSTSALSNTSTPVTITLNPLVMCFCTPETTNCINDNIVNVAFQTINNSSGCAASNGFEDFTGTVASATVTAGQTYSIVTTISYDGNENAAAWIDYDHNGIFDTYEYKNLGSTSASTYSILATLDIPANAVPGLTRMRIRNFAGPTPSPSNACDNPGGGAKLSSVSVTGPPITMGETEDYLITILPPDCSTANFPPSVDPIATSTLICAGATVGLDLNMAMPVASGITYQWKSSPDGSIYTSIGSPIATSSLAVNPSQTTYYLCDVLCNSTSVLTSTFIIVNVSDVSTSYVTSNVNCFGGTTGAISLTPNGGIAPYTYTWSPNGGNGVIASNLAAGVYQCIIQDVNGCTDTISTSITEPSALVLTVTNINNVTCFGLSDGVADVTATGGTPNYTFSWAPFGGTMPQATGLSAGNYTCTVTDANNCSTTQTVTITQPTVLNAVTSSTQVSCFGNSNGQAEVSVTGGTGVYSYVWSPLGATTPIATGLSAGIYTVNVLDANNCSASQTVIVTQPTLLTATNSQTNVTCFGGNDGSAEVMPSGGTSPYTYNWSGGGVNALETNLSAQSYTCIITDFNGCATSQIVSLTQGTQIALAVNGTSSMCHNTSSTYTVNVTNAVGSTTYNWTSTLSGSASTSAAFNFTATVTGAETIYVTVTDANGCSQSSTAFPVNVAPSTNIYGTALTATTSVPVAGTVILYKYEPFFTKFDSVTVVPLDASGNYTFTSVNEGTYIVKAVPTATALQITYNDSEVNWKTANQITHGCVSNANSNISVIPLASVGTGTGSMSGTIRQGNGYGHRMSSTSGVAAPGQPIGGIIVKGGKNPGGNMFVQTTTAADGTYTLSGLPTDGSEFFILVDIPGLDTNGTYYRTFTITSSQYTYLDFMVDSIQINPTSDVGVHNLNAIEHKIKVFPNPATNLVNIEYSLVSESNVEIELFDILGKSVKDILPPTLQTSNNYSHVVKTDDLNSGIYFIKLRINNRETVIKLFVTD